MMRRRKKLKTAIYRRLCIILPFSSLFPHAACRLVLVGLLLCVGTAIAVRPARAAEKKSEKPYALIFGTVWGPDNHPVYGVRVKIRRTDDKKPRSPEDLLRDGAVALILRGLRPVLHWRRRALDP